MSRSGPPPFQTGLRGRCPNCGEGALFVGFLKFADHCEACGADFDVEDAGDGPAIFVIFIVGIVIIPAALAFSLITNAPTWVTLIIWTPILIASSIWLLRPLRGIMFAMQWTHKALEVRNQDVSQGETPSNDTDQ